MKNLQDHCGAPHHQAIQKYLTELEKWEGEWKLGFHPKKCNVLPISRSTKKKETKHDYILHDETLERVSETKYASSVWDPHCKKKILIR